MLSIAGDSHKSTIPEKSKNTAELPIGVDDTYELPCGCEDITIKGNVFDNDILNGAEHVKILYAVAPEVGIFSIGTKGNFIFKLDSYFEGEIKFTYRICNANNTQLFTDATVTIIAEDDHDCDLIINSLDIDNDNDGILDIHEGDEDTDNDGIPNYYDIDSDNDGITDMVEWQTEVSDIILLKSDLNNDGWDDAFDGQTGGEYYEQTDTDQDGIPDFLDSDSDNDGIEDHIEAYDLNNDGIAEIIVDTIDSDNDGLFDVYDTTPSRQDMGNPMGSSSPLPDFNADGIRDWRDVTNHPLPGTELAMSKSELIVYPNPVNGICTVQLPFSNPEKGVYSLRLFNMNGSEILSQEANFSKFEINTNGLASGKYLLRVNCDAGTFSAKIIKKN